MRASTSNITIENDIVKKDIILNKYYKFSVFEREAYWLLKFNKDSFTPDKIKINFQDEILEMSMVGEPLNKNNKPKDFISQLKNILDFLIKNNCSHNDINLENLLVKNGIIKIIDFGWSTFIDDNMFNYSDREIILLSKNNKSIFPYELNLVNRNNNILDDLFAMNNMIKSLI